MSALALPEDWQEWPPLAQAELLAELRRRWYFANPDRYVVDVLGEAIYSKQVEILRSIAHHRRTAVPSCFASGKSWSAARAACWWLETHRPGEAFVVSTAPTGPQVRAILWREINRAHSRGRRGLEGDPEITPGKRPTLLGRVNQTEWWMGTELVGYGRKPDEHNPDAFSGIHAAAVLVIIDEANGVPGSLFEASEGLIANEDSRILAIGNPNSSGTYFAEICKAATHYHVIHISAYDTPALTGEPMPDLVLRQLVGRMWVEEQIQRRGIDSPYVIAKVFGRFPDDNKRAVIPTSWIRRRQAVFADGHGLGTNADMEPLTLEQILALQPVSLGVDIGASEDGDPTVIYEVRGGRPCRAWEFHSSDEDVVVGEVVQRIRETGAARVQIDSIGVGHGVASRLGNMSRDGLIACDVYAINVSMPPVDFADEDEALQTPAGDLFPNIRSQMWWLLRDLLRDQKIDMTDVDEETVLELITPEYKPSPQGRTVVEPKAEIKKRLQGRSTDHADALLLALFQPPAPDADEGILEVDAGYTISPF